VHPTHNKCQHTARQQARIHTIQCLHTIHRSPKTTYTCLLWHKSRTHSCASDTSPTMGTTTQLSSRLASPQHTPYLDCLSAAELSH
jgi:hypothetical protein